MQPIVVKQNRNEMNDNQDNEQSARASSQVKESLLQRLQKMRGWFSFTILLIFGSLVLVTPGAVICILNPDAVPNFSTNADPKLLQSAEYQGARYSFWFAITWIIYVTSAFFLDGLPALIVGTILFVFGECSERIRRKVHIILIVKPWIHSLIASFGALIMHRFMFFQKDLIQSWKDTFNCVFTLTIISLILLGQRLLVQNIAFNFHQVSYKDRIIESKEKLEVLDKLRKAIQAFGLARIFTTSETNSAMNTFGFSGFSKENTKESTEEIAEIPTITVDTPAQDADKLDIAEQNLQIKIDSQEKRSTSMSSIHSKQSYLDRQKDIDQQVEEIKKNQSLQIGSYVEKVKHNFDLYSDNNAANLGQELFDALEPDKGVSVDAFRKYFENEEDAMRAFKLFDRDSDGSVSLDEFKQAVTVIYREKRALTDSLSDLSEALGNLNKILYVFSFTITLIVVFPIWGISLNAIVPFTSILVALSFIFGGSARKTFECIIFLFVTHPFDSGDLISIDDKYYLVQELSILQTVLTIEGKIFYMPNGIKNINQDVLATKTIFNARRSNNIQDVITIKVDLFTDRKKLDSLKGKMLKFLISNPRIFLPSMRMDLLDMGTANMITLRLTIDFKGNWTTPAKRWENRSMFMYALKDALCQLEIKFMLPQQDVKLIQ